MSEYKDPNSRGTFREIIRDPNKKRDEATNELSFLLRDILQEHQFSVGQWENMTDKFFGAMHGDDRKMVAQAKINLSRGLAKDGLTWRRFQQALLVMGYDNYEVTISMSNRGDTKPREHKVKFKNPYKGRRAHKPVMNMEDNDE